MHAHRLRSSRRPALATLLALAALLALAGTARAATLTVTTSSDADAADGACSLREAIIAINAGADRRECIATGAAYGSDDRIGFDIPGSGVHTILMGGNFQGIVKPVVIDGLTQPGASCDAWPPTLKVELDGQAIAFRGLMLDPGSGGSLVRGLVIGGMANAGDNFSAGIQLRSNGNRVECNYIGLRADGSTPNPNRRGVDINSAHENIIGTDGVLPALGRRNLISGNVYSGVNTRGASPSRNIIAGNYIGVDASGTQSRSNRIGVGINGQGGSPPALDNVVGYNGTGSPEFARNVISGNSGTSAAGISMVVNAQRTRIAGNYIGLSASGTVAVPNRIGLELGSNSSVLDNLIGFPSSQPLAVSGNVISGNEFAGIAINGYNGTNRTFIVGNLIGTYPNGDPGLPNGGLGISLSTTPDTLVHGNVISGHGQGIRLQGSTGRSLPTFLNGTALPTGGDPLDSSGNCITGNTAGVVVSLNGSVSRTAVFASNWWGAANGPSGAGTGSGDSVSGGVTYAPFLTAAPAGCAATPVADLAVEVSGVPDPLVAGASFVATLGASNAGPDPALEAVLRISGPAFLLLDPPPGCAVEGEQLVCALGTIADGGSRSADVPISVPADAGGQVSLTVSVTSPTLDPAAGNNSVIVARAIERQADLSVQVANDQASLVEGVATRYRISVANAGPSQVEGASLSVPVPGGLANAAWTCMPGTGAGCPPSGTGAIVAALSLPPQGAVEFLLDAMVAGPGPVALSATAGVPPGVSETDAGNDADSLALDVARVHDLSVLLETDAVEVRAGQPLVFRIRVANAGPSHADGALVELLLGEGANDLLWSCSAGGGASCTAAGSGTLLESVDLPAGADLVFENAITVGQVSELSLAAMVVEPVDGTDPDGDDNSDSLDLVVLPPPSNEVFGNGFEPD